MSNITTAMCALDLHENPEQLLEQALTFTSQLNVSQLILLYVLKPSFHPTSDGPVEEHDNKPVKEHAEQRLSTLVQRIDTKENVRCVATEGDAASSILAAAETEQVDLLILGTAGRKGLARMVLGSVSEEVTRRSHIPVLILR